MAAIVQTPLLFGSAAVELASDGSTWRKRVLPVGQVEYKGTMLTFDADYLKTLAASFNSRAYDQVPFQLADARNTHTNDPERFRGEVTAMSADDSGLWVTVQTTPEGGALLASNPRLGVSARIVEQYRRSDGQHFPAAIQHVLGTLDPRIPELGAWEPVTADFSNGYADAAPELIIDLSASDWDGEPGYEDAGDGWLTAAELANLSDDEREVYECGDPLDFAEYLMAKSQAFTLANDDDDDDNGLTARGKGIYAKLTAKGVKPAVALAMARRAQTKTPGKQFANDGYAADPAGAMIELAAHQAAQMQAEDAARPTRRTSGTAATEDRLAYALGRIGRGTYSATTAQRNLGFAGDGGHGHGGQGCSCGATSPTGTTVSRYHEAGCEMALSADDVAEYGRSGVYAEVAARAFTDANGRSWADQRGDAMTLADHLEALTGQRVTRSPFEGLDRPELAAAQRAVRFGDYDDDADPGRDMTAASQQTVAALKHVMGLPDQAQQRQERQNTAIDRLVNRPPMRHRSLGEAMDYGESTAERADRYRQPIMSGVGMSAVGWDDGNTLPGELVPLTYG